VADGLVFAPTLDGYLHCLDAKTGRKHWTHDALSAINCSPLALDGKLYVTTEDGDVLVFALAREKNLLRKTDMAAWPAGSSPVFANGTLYIATRGMLHAIREAR
jgi:outer membrane protein assembly factor BamB